jgi:hypothetical protein
VHSNIDSNIGCQRILLLSFEGAKLLSVAVQRRGGKLPRTSDYCKGRLCSTRLMFLTINKVDECI